MNSKAIALLSGGLDSTLAVKLILDQGIEVEALNFVTPFCTCNRGGGGCAAKRVADEVSIPCKTVAVTDEFFQVIRNPSTTRPPCSPTETTHGTILRSTCRVSGSPSGVVTVA